MLQKAVLSEIGRNGSLAEIIMSRRKWLVICRQFSLVATAALSLEREIVSFSSVRLVDCLLLRDLSVFCFFIWLNYPSLTMTLSVLAWVKPLCHHSR